MKKKLLKILDIIFEILSLIGLGLILYLLIITYPELPDRIPKHWNFKGVADQWGDKTNFLTIPIVSLFIYGIFSYVTMNQSNKAKLSINVGEINAKQIIRLNRIFKTVLIGIFLLDIYGQSMNFLGKEAIISGSGVLTKIIIILIILTFLEVIIEPIFSFRCTHYYNNRIWSCNNHW